MFLGLLVGLRVDNTTPAPSSRFQLQNIIQIASGTDSLTESMHRACPWCGLLVHDLVFVHDLAPCHRGRGAHDLIVTMASSQCFGQKTHRHFLFKIHQCNELQIVSVVFVHNLKCVLSLDGRIKIRILQTVCVSMWTHLVFRCPAKAEMLYALSSRLRPLCGTPCLRRVLSR